MLSESLNESGSAKLRRFISQLESKQERIRNKNLPVKILSDYIGQKSFSLKIKE